MPSDTDLINTTLRDLRGPLEMGFEQMTPLFDELIKSGKVNTTGGTSIDWTYMMGSPNKGKGVYGGGETIPLGRTQQTKTCSVGFHRLVAALSIPKREILRNRGSAGIMKLMEKYPVAFVAGAAMDMDRFMFTGVSNGNSFDTAELQGFNHFNGQRTSAQGVTGVTAGLFEHNVKASQTSTRQSLASSTAYHYFTQYGEITSWADNGEETLKAQHRNAVQYKLAGKGPNIVWCDGDTFANYERTQKALVKIVKIGDQKDNGSANEARYPGAIYNADLVYCANIVLTDFTGDALEGAAYGTTMEHLSWEWLQKPEVSDFEDRIATADAIVAKYEAEGVFRMEVLPSHFLVVGGARR